jgi:hypothetical protein
MSDTKKAISNIVFTKNRPLQLDAYLESLYRYFPSELIQTYIIYKEELFVQEYERLFDKFSDCIVVREGDFHRDFMYVLDHIQTKYILFGVDDVVFFDSVDFNVIDRTFIEQRDNIFGFALRFSPFSLKDSEDIITEHTIANETVYRLNWKNGQTVHTRYPFEVSCSFYSTEFVRRIVNSSMSGNALVRSMFTPDSLLVRSVKKMRWKRKILKHFGLFFNPNTFESWPCRWCRNNSKQLPDYTYFQKLCGCAIQVNMVNTSTRNAHYGTDEHTVEALNDRYKNDYRVDIDFVAEKRPTEPGGGREYFKLKKVGTRDGI